MLSRVKHGAVVISGLTAIVLAMGVPMETEEIGVNGFHLWASVEG